MAARIEDVFDYQRFSPNKHLEKIIADVECRYAELDDAELELVNAAGIALNLYGSSSQENSGNTPRGKAR